MNSYMVQDRNQWCDFYDKTTNLRITSSATINFSSQATFLGPMCCSRGLLEKQEMVIQF